jgi:antitoxin (DNA-binding transcriptional repressor) of toxin-antitoxin stability system
MKTATVRELRTQFPKLEAMLYSGETIAITKRSRVVARLIPEAGAARPDFRARFGGKQPAAGQRERSIVGLLADERGE